MAESFQCPSCGKSLALLAELAGKKGRCQACGTVFVVPVPSQPVTPAASLRPARPPVAKPAQPATSAEPQAQAAPRQGTRLGAFVAGHRLMLAVVAVALAASVAISVVGQPLVGIAVALLGFGIAPFGLMPVPAPHQSQSGKYFAAVAGLALVNLILTAALFGYLRAPAELSTAVRVVFYLGLVTGLGILVALVALGSFVMSRFGFFRPAAWGYVGVVPCVFLATLFLLGRSPTPPQVAVVPPPAAVPAPQAQTAAPVPVSPPPAPAAPSLDPGQLQKMVDQLQVMAELSEATQKLATDPQKALDDLDRIAQKYSGAGASQMIPGGGASPAGNMSLDQKLGGIVAGLNELADALATIRDEPTARATAAKVREVVARTRQLIATPAAIDPKAVAGMADYNARTQAATERLGKEAARLAPLPGCGDLAAEVNAFLAQVRTPPPPR